MIDYATKVLGSNPATSVRDWKSLGALDINGSVQPNAYVDATNGANLLLVSAGSYWGYVHAPYGLGERYAHGPKVGNETCNSVGPWEVTITWVFGATQVTADQNRCYENNSI